MIGQIWLYPTHAGPLDKDSVKYVGTTEHFLHMPEE